MESVQGQIATISIPVSIPVDSSSGASALRSRRDRLIIGSVAAAILIWQLLIPPVVGVANNSDFGKLLGHYDIGAPILPEYATTRYVHDYKYHWDSRFYSSELLFIRAGVAINKVLSKDGTLDIRVMGFVHGAMFLAAILLLVPLTVGSSPLLRWSFWAISLFMFCDALHVLYLNTFYMDVAAYLGLLLAAVLYLRVSRWRRTGETICLAACAFLIIGSKPQHAVLGVWLALLCWVERAVLCSGRRIVAAGVSATLLLASWATLRFTAPDGYAGRGCFNVIFWQILPHSRNVSEAIADLGLDDSYRVWIGRHAYSEGVPQEEEIFFAPFQRKVPYSRVAAFLLTHPRDAYLALRVSLNEAGRQRPIYGNFDPGSGAAPFAQSQAFATWSDFKARKFRGKGPRLVFSFLALAALGMGLLCAQRRTLPPGTFTAGICLIGMTFTELLVSSLADAVDVPRHHWIFFAQTDMLLLMSFWLAARLWKLRVNPGTF